MFLAVLAVFVLGPERLPKYAKQFANLVKQLRKMALGAQQQLQDELGEEYEQVDWKKLDPRQYDPRKIIQDVLEEEVAPIKNILVNPLVSAQLEKPKSAKLLPNQRAPFDSEAT